MATIRTVFVDCPWKNAQSELSLFYHHTANKRHGAFI